jgi:hypothetical protein
MTFRRDMACDGGNHFSRRVIASGCNGAATGHALGMTIQLLIGLEATMRATRATDFIPEKHTVCGGR